MSDRREPRDAGFTLAELLVAMGLFAIISTIMLTLAIVTSRTTEVVRANADANGEARVAIERMAREMRQARAVKDVVFDASGGITALTLLVDFEDSSGSTVTDAVRYTWDVADESLLMQITRGSSTQGDQILARAVTGMDVTLASSFWPADRYQGDGTTPGADGRTDWVELSRYTAPPVHGDGNDTLSNTEAAFVDFLSIRLDVEDGDRTVTYALSTDLRNAAGAQ